MDRFLIKVISIIKFSSHNEISLCIRYSRAIPCPWLFSARPFNKTQAILTPEMVAIVWNNWTILHKARQFILAGNYTHFFSLKGQRRSSAGFFVKKVNPHAAYVKALVDIFQQISRAWHSRDNRTMSWWLHKCWKRFAMLQYIAFITLFNLWTTSFSSGNLCEHLHRKYLHPDHAKNLTYTLIALGYYFRI